MSPGLRRLVALGILGLGACAALPFYQRPSRLPVPHGGRNGEDLAWRSLDLHLQAPAAPRASPQAAAPVLPPPAVRHLSPPASVHPPPASESVPPPELDFKYPSLRPPLPPSAALPGHPGFAQQAYPPVRRHRVADGDTLEDLARKYLGNGQRALEIFEANQGRLEDPDVLPLGVELAIPSAEARDPRHGPPSGGLEGTTSAADAEELVPVRSRPRN